MSGFDGRFHVLLKTLPLVSSRAGFPPHPENMKKTFASVLSVAFSATAAHAALSITNGDFAADATQTQNVTGWYDRGATGNWWESTWAGPTVSPNGTSVLGLSYMFATSNWAYQGIGTNSDSATSITVGFDAGSFTDAAGSRDLGVTVSLYKTDGSFVPGDDVDIAGAAGVTLLDSFSWTALVAPGAMVTGITDSLDLSGASSTDQLFLRFVNFAGATGEPWTAVDNITISPVPEPGAALLGGLGVFGLMRRRRN